MRQIPCTWLVNCVLFTVTMSHQQYSNTAIGISITELSTQPEALWWNPIRHEEKLYWLHLCLCLNISSKIGHYARHASLPTLLLIMWLRWCNVIGQENLLHSFTLPQYYPYQHNPWNIDSNDWTVIDFSQGHPGICIHMLCWQIQPLIYSL